MNPILPNTPKADPQPCWTQRKRTDDHAQFLCLKGELASSIIWIRLYEEPTGGRHCGIELRQSKQNLNQSFLCNQEFVEPGYDYQLVDTKFALTKEENFTFRFIAGDKTSKIFLKQIELINKTALLGQPFFSDICELVIRPNFLPVLNFLCAMHANESNGTAFPHDVQGIICHILYQQAIVEIPENCSEESKKKIISLALQAPKTDKEKATDTVIKTPKTKSRKGCSIM